MATGDKPRPSFVSPVVANINNRIFIYMKNSSTTVCVAESC